MWFKTKCLELVLRDAALVKEGSQPVYVIGVNPAPSGDRVGTGLPVKLITAEEHDMLATYLPKRLNDHLCRQLYARPASPGLRWAFFRNYILYIYIGSTQPRAIHPLPNAKDVYSPPYPLPCLCSS